MSDGCADHHASVIAIFNKFFERRNTAINRPIGSMDDVCASAVASSSMCAGLSGNICRAESASTLACKSGLALLQVGKQVAVQVDFHEFAFASVRRGRHLTFIKTIKVLQRSTAGRFLAFPARQADCVSS